MQTGTAIGVNLSDLGLYITMLNWSSRIFKHFDSLTKLLDSFLVSLLSELIIAFVFQCSKFIFNFLVVCIVGSFRNRSRFSFFLIIWRFLCLRCGFLRWRWSLLDFLNFRLLLRCRCRRSWCRSCRLRSKLWQIRKLNIFFIGNVVDPFVLLDIFQASLHCLLGLLV